MNNEMLGIREKGTYLYFNGDGKIVRNVEHGTAGAVKRVNKEGREVSEIFFDFVIGKIVSLKSEKTDYGRQWKMVIENGESRAIVNMGYNSNYAKAILKCFENIDLSKPVEFSPSMKLEDGDKKTSLFLYQESPETNKKELVAYAYKKDAPKDMPDRELVTQNGEEKWDYTKQLQFLELKAEEHFMKSGIEVNKVEDPRLANTTSQTNEDTAVASEEDELAGIENTKF